MSLSPRFVGAFSSYCEHAAALLSDAVRLDGCSRCDRWL